MVNNLVLTYLFYMQNIMYYIQIQRKQLFQNSFKNMLKRFFFFFECVICVKNMFVLTVDNLHMYFLPICQICLN